MLRVRPQRGHPRHCTTVGIGPGPHLGKHKCNTNVPVCLAMQQFRIFPWLLLQPSESLHEQKFKHSMILDTAIQIKVSAQYFGDIILVREAINNSWNLDICQLILAPRQSKDYFNNRLYYTEICRNSSSLLLASCYLFQAPKSLSYNGNFRTASISIISKNKVPIGWY